MTNVLKTRKGTYGYTRKRARTDDAASVLNASNTLLIGIIAVVRHERIEQVFLSLPSLTLVLAPEIARDCGTPGDWTVVYHVSLL